MTSIKKCTNNKLHFFSVSVWKAGRLYCGLAGENPLADGAACLTVMFDCLKNFV
jgi:hypothetical protein